MKSKVTIEKAKFRNRYFIVIKYKDFDKSLLVTADELIQIHNRIIEAIDVGYKKLKKETKNEKRT